MWRRAFLSLICLDREGRGAPGDSYLCPMLQVENVTKSFGDLVLFDSISFSIEEGEKVGLIAPNGSGKTSLMKLLVGSESVDSGRIVYESSVRVAYLEQYGNLQPGWTIRDAIFDSADPVARLVGRWEDAVLEGNNQLMAELSVQMDALAAWDYERRAAEVLSRLGLTDTGRAVDTLSGGERKRIALAKILISESELLLLDEPTNHLDMTTIDWLEDYLSRSRQTLLLITHDRYFLNRICNRIIEIDQKQIYKYAGNYEYYIEKREARIEQTEAARTKAANLLRRELDWMRRQPQARGGKAKYRVDAFYELEKKAKQQRQDAAIDLSKNTAAYIGKKIFEMRSIKKSYGEKCIVRDFSYDFARYDKVGIIGENGVGKTTFLRILLGLEQPDAGSIEVGETVRFGYYRQEDPPFDRKKRVIDIVSEIADTIHYPDGQQIGASQLLTQFLFSPERQYTPVEKLSGGELRRLYLCTILIGAPNFLILDEPTNDLDIVTLTVLEDYLAEFHGCVIIVSHDRFFMDRVVSHLFTFDGGGEIGDFPGNYSQWREWHEAKRQYEIEKKKELEPQYVQEKRKESPRPKKKLSYKEERELESIQEAIPSLEEEKKELEAKMSSGEMQGDALMAAGERIGMLIDKIDELTMRWLELEDSIDQCNS